MKLSSFQAFRSTFISIISYFISYNSYFLSHDMTGYHGQKYQTYKKLLKCSVVLGMYIGIFEKVKGILRFTSSYICTFPMKLRSKSIDYAHDDDVIKMKSPCLLSFSQGQVIKSCNCCNSDSLVLSSKSYSLFSVGRQFSYYDGEPSKFCRQTELELLSQHYTLKSNSDSPISE